MVVGAFPAAKLGALLLRQVSKPIANFVKERAKSSRFFRNYVCMPPAQFYNFCDVKMKMWLMNLGKPTEIPSLNEAMAIELGANLLGEAIIFVIAAGILFLEYNRQARKEATKEEARVSEMSMLTSTLQDLYFQAEMHDTQIRELTRHIHDLENKLKPRGPSNGLIKPQDSNSDGDPNVNETEDVSYCITNPGVILRLIRTLNTVEINDKDTGDSITYRNGYKILWLPNVIL